MDEIKILFLAANPTDSTRLALDEEARSIQNTLRLSEYRYKINFKTRWAVRPDDLLQTLNEESPHIVHFSGHGVGQEGLVLNDDNGTSRLVSTSALQKLFKTLRDNIKLIVLNACYSREQAEGLSEIVDIVIGMKDTIGDKAACKFSSSFYRAIGFGRSLQNAFDQGIVSMALYNMADTDVPELWCHKDIKPGIYYLFGNDENVLNDPGKYEFRGTDKQLSVQKTDKTAGNEFLNKKLPVLIDRVRTSISAISIMMLDIDELTLINKHYGNEVGDKVISTIVDSILNNIDSEHFGRCGDDTFYAVLASKNVDEAIEIAYMLRTNIQNYNWASISSNLRVTCTFSVAQLRNFEPTIEWIVRAADGLIKAKNLSRNRVEKSPLYLQKGQSLNLSHYYS